MSAKYHDLENKRIFVTGGGSGIGASIVEHFCEQNSDVYFVDINVEESNKLISDIKNKNFKIPTFFECDLLNIKQLQNTISKIISDKGPINILINNKKNIHVIKEAIVPGAFSIFPILNSVKKSKLNFLFIIFYRNYNFRSYCFLFSN